ncbi:recombinase family protein [Pseudomonas panipatensis]|uniref:recombinase family protein n=1 Tax=Pseudomonas panipatensis TaxID=428992 RepID=UPI0035B3632F
MPLAIPYIRFSTKEQLAGSSLARQEADVAKWLRENPEYELAPSYQDLGVSGTGKHLAEGNLGRLIEAVANGMVPPGAVILVEAVDRFTRLEPLDAVGPLKTIVKAGVALVDLEAGVKYDRQSLQGDALLMFLFRAKSAYEYSARLGGRIAASYEERAKQAKLGQTIKRRHGFWLTSEGKLIGDKAEIVRDVFRRFLNGEPVRSIARHYGNIFKTPASCKKLLKNPATIGNWQRVRVEKVGAKREVVQGELIQKAFDAAIEDAEYYQTQALLAETASPGFTNARKFPLAGLIRCSECESKMVLVRAGPNTKTNRVRCPNRNSGEHSCSNGITIPTPVLMYFFSMTHLPYAYRGFQATRLPELARRRIEIQGKLAQVDKERRGAARRMDIDPDDPEHEVQYLAKVQEAKALQAELDGMQESPEATDFDLEALISLGHADAHGQPNSLIQELNAFMATHDDLSFNRILQLGGYSITVHPDGALTAGDPALYAGEAVSGINEGRYLGYARKAKLFRFEHGPLFRRINEDGKHVPE